MSRLSKPFRAPPLFLYLSEAYRRAAEEDALARTIPKERREQIKADAHEMIVNYAALYFQVPQLFQHSPSTPEQCNVEHPKLIFSAFEHGPAISPEFFGRFVDQLVDQNADDVPRIFGPVIQRMAQELKGKRLGEPMGVALRILLQLVKDKHISKLLVSHSVFKPPATPMGLGWRLLTETILGHILGPSTLDFELDFQQAAAMPMAMPMSASPQRPTPPSSAVSVRQKHYSDVATGRKSRQAIEQSTKQLRQDLSHLQDSARDAVMPLLKASSETRLATLEWFAAVLKANESRAKMARHFGQDAPMSSQAALMLRFSGCASGFALNTLWALLRLAEPIPGAKLPELDPFFCLRDDAGRLLGALTGDSKLGGSDEAVKLAVGDFVRTANATEPKFITQVFWLTARACGVILRPSITDYERVLINLQKMNPGGHPPTNPQVAAELDLILGEMLCWECYLLDPHFLKMLGSFVSRFLTWLLYNIFAYLPNGASSGVFATDTQTTGIPLTAVWRAVAERFPLKQDPSPQFCCLPVSLVEDLFDCIHECMKSRLVVVLDHLDLELLINACLFCIGSPGYFRNPHTRSNAASIIWSMLQNKNHTLKVEGSSVLRRHLVPALIGLFIDAESTGQHIKFNVRYPIIQIFEKLLKIEAYRQALHSFGQTDNAVFCRFIHMLLNDTMYFLEEGMSKIVEVRHREQQGETAQPDEEEEDETPQPQQQQQQQQQTQASSAGSGSQNPEGPTTERQKLSTLKRIARQCITIGQSEIALFWLISKEVPDVLLQSKPIIPQIVGALNCNVHSLVGPKALELKVANPKEEYGFDPRQLLKEVAETYAYLASSSRGGDFVDEIPKEERYFSVQTFKKAARIIRREGLINRDILTKFDNLVAELEERATVSMMEMEDEDIPEEFQCEIINDLLVDPVKLPSGHVVNRNVIERHLLSTPLNPFNRQPLSVDQLEPQPELKARIDEWRASRPARKSARMTDS
ncbi:unnamed protein product [Vitrella brassicaformis CCMP3155]|uniref:RING-type E3 ubiquitin transferase n=1 Tax=Vitrella brassicaformis (strain CCMP3155) TaxID=1169540 RepID=A0A0G4EQ28_VITBC|nr:unnamed protein product [Vitrella brassicaformis CCMP3155]|eukprot:CEL99391.1 unnamed protein product [Vitrella brassicaformis CCMP3155]